MIYHISATSCSNCNVMSTLFCLCWPFFSLSLQKIETDLPYSNFFNQWQIDTHTSFCATEWESLVFSICSLLCWYYSHYVVGKQNKIKHTKKIFRDFTTKIFSSEEIWLTVFNFKAVLEELISTQFHVKQC